MTDDKRYFTFRIPKGVLIYIVALLCFFGLITTYNNWPRYIVLNPPIPDKVFIISEEKAVYTPYTAGDVKLENDKIWMWRKKYDFLPIGGESYTSESILAYFDNWLNEQGWKKFEEQGFPCGDMTESDFLERGTNLFAYIPKNASSPYSSPAVCVAVWSYTTANKTTGFTALLFTTTD